VLVCFPTAQLGARFLAGAPFLPPSIFRRVRIGYALNREWIAVNPAAKPELVEAAPRRAEAENAFFEFAGAELTLAYMLAAYAAQREGDLLVTAWQQVRGDRLALRQAKTSTLLEVPLHRDLSAALNVAKRRATMILTTPNGRPWSTNWFQHSWKRAVIQAGVDQHGLQFRDLHRTAMVRPAEAGATVPEIAAESGHTIETTERILEVYVPRTYAMAKSAIVKLEQFRKAKNDQ
jgi:hypothetical protein